MVLSKETLILLAKYPDLIGYPRDHPVVIKLKEAVEADTYHYGRQIIRYDADTCKQINCYQDIRHVAPGPGPGERTTTVILEACKRQSLYKGSFWRFADQDIKPGGALGLSIERKKKLKGEGRNEA